MHKSLNMFNPINTQKRYQVPINSGLSQLLTQVKTIHINIFAYSARSQIKQDCSLWQDRFSAVLTYSTDY